MALDINGKSIKVGDLVKFRFKWDTVIGEVTNIKEEGSFFDAVTVYDKITDRLFYFEPADGTILMPCEYSCGIELYKSEAV